MTDKKISELDDADTLTGAELIAIVQDGVTRRTSLLAIKEIGLATVPDDFATEDWSVASGNEQAVVTINSLPADNGADITDVQYRVDSGSWVSSLGVSSFAITGLTNDHAYDVELRAVNSVGSGAASDIKSVTPKWSPLGLGSKLQAWWDHGDTATLKQSSAGTGDVTADTDPVGYVQDKSGNGRHKIQATSGNRPQYRTNTGKARLVYDGVNDVLSVAYAGFTLPTLEVYAIASAITTAGNHHGFLTFNASGVADWNSTSAISWAFGTAPELFASSPGLSVLRSLNAGGMSGVHRHELIVETTLCRVRSTGTSSGEAETVDSSFTAHAGTHTGSFMEGARDYSGDGAPKNFLGCAIHEIVIAAGLTSGERTAVRAYLDAKWRS